MDDAQRTAARAAAGCRRLPRQAALAREDAAFAELGRQGVDVVRPTAAQRAVWRAAVDPVWAKWTGPIGADLVAAALAATKG
jgi:C4-dicarboxylate-binding protein DctP